jgi:tripeptide aminopeptidase
MSFNIDYLEILRTQSKSGECSRMIQEVNRQLDLIEGITRYTDEYGNIYVTKGEAETYPAFVSHLDTVHPIYNTFTVCKTELNYLYAYTEDDGFKQVGIGGDDKCGIIVCLELLFRLKNVKCAFFLDEETGCKGSKAGDLTFFDNCRYAIQIDRRNDYGTDIITSGSGTELCSPEFKEFITELGKVYSYAPTTGATTDVVALKERGLGISACNLSAGYYNPHSKQEYIDEDDLINCLNFCVAIAKIKTVYPHKYEKPKYTGYSGYSGKYKGTSQQSLLPSAPQGRKCFKCLDSLTSYDGVVCKKCVFQSLRLIEKIDGEKVLEQTAFDNCLQCEIGLYTQTDYESGYCEKCRYCNECGDDLSDSQEFEIGYCFDCCYTDSVTQCNTPNCKELLVTADDRQAGHCIPCLEEMFYRDTGIYCPMTDCEEYLLTDDEIQQGFCSNCVQQFQSKGA